MATPIGATWRYKGQSAVAESLQFRRKDKEEKTKKIRRRVKLRAKHILTYFFLVGGIFLVVQKVCLFLISWEKLSVTRVDVQCQKEGVREDVTRFLRGKHLGNLVLLDIHTLKKSLLTHPWIKDVHVRKSFPSTVRIEIKERIPFALMESEALYLIDREGVKLQKVDPEHPGSYPLLKDAHLFKNDITAKLDLAWECLESFKSRQIQPVSAIDLTEYDNARVQLRDSPTWFILGGANIKEKIDLLLTHQDTLEPYGVLEHVDLRFKDRLYIKPLESWAGNDIVSTDKEAN